MTNTELGMAIFMKHIALSITDPRLFRRTVMDEMMATFQCSNASSATRYNNCKNSLSQPIPGLGREQKSAQVVNGAAGTNGPKKMSDDQDECWSVLEVITRGPRQIVGRFRSFLLQGDASECFDEKVETYPNTNWVMIYGIGPLLGEVYKLTDEEKELKRYETKTLKADLQDYSFEVDEKIVTISASTRNEGLLLLEGRYPNSSIMAV